MVGASLASWVLAVFVVTSAANYLGRSFLASLPKLLRDASAFFADSAGNSLLLWGHSAGVLVRKRLHMDRVLSAHGRFAHNRCVVRHIRTSSPQSDVNELLERWRRDRDWKIKRTCMGKCRQRTTS
jgi:hypothetical protein